MKAAMLYGTTDRSMWPVGAIESRLLDRVERVCAIPTKKFHFAQTADVRNFDVWRKRNALDRIGKMHIGHRSAATVAHSILKSNHRTKPLLRNILMSECKPTCRGPGTVALRIMLRETTERLFD